MPVAGLWDPMRQTLVRAATEYEALSGLAPWSSRRRLVGITIGLAAFCATRIGFLLANPPHVPPATDEHGYFLIARDFADWWQNGNAVRGPGHPALLALLGADPRTAQFGLVAVELLALAVFVVMVGSRWGDLAATVAGALWILYPAFPYHEWSPVTEVPATLLVALLAGPLLATGTATARRGLAMFAVVGALAGALELVRPTSGRAILLVAALLALRQPGWRRRSTALVAAVLAFLIATAPWLYRNQDNYGKPLFTTLSPHNALIGVLPPEAAEKGWGTGFDVNNGLRATFWDRDDLAKGQADSETLWRFVREDSLEFKRALVRDHAPRPGELWLRFSVGGDEVAGGAKELVGDRLLPLFHAFHVLLVLAAIGAVATISRLRRDSLPWIGVVLVLTMLVTLLSVPQARYALPYMPFVIAWAAVGGVTVARAIRFKSSAPACD